jgi:O-succinylbenzoic acid--CoA ligase
VADLVALDLPGGADFVRALITCWDAGDAVAPIDPRLPDAERRLVLDALRPSSLIGPDGRRSPLPGGAPVEPGDAVVLATSGTTGRPKGVVHTHASVAASARATSAALEVDPAADRWLACLPLAHIGGLSVVLRSLVTGTPVEVHDGFRADAVIAAARDRGATLTSLVTRALAQVPASLFRRVLIGGAAPPPDRPANVIATYGMTETGSGIVYERTPLDGIELRIDADGQIWVRGPMLLRCYRDGTDPKDADGWFPTGDLGSFAPGDGRLMVHGRAGDVIVTGGEKVWPERVEAVLRTVPGVADVAVVGRAHPEWGHEVVAVVVPGPDGPPTLDALRGAVRGTLPVWCAPRAVVAVAGPLPRTGLGKLRRGVLAGHVAPAPSPR